MNPTLILALINAGLTIAENIPALVSHLKQSGELTPEQEAALDDRIAKLKDQPHWKKE
jgi:hypothetical protein